MSDVVIVTGAASGLGAVYCRELGAAGYTVVGADLDPVDGVDLGLSVDVTERASTERRTEAVLERFGRVDALVNNAAVYSTIVKRPFEEITDEEWDRVLEVAPTLAAQRIFAREQAPEDLVGALLFLLGPGSDFVTGQNIWVNGGRAFN